MASVKPNSDRWMRLRDPGSTGSARAFTRTLTTWATWTCYETPQHPEEAAGGQQKFGDVWKATWDEIQRVRQTWRIGFERDDAYQQHRIGKTYPG